MGAHGDLLRQLDGEVPLQAELWERVLGEGALKGTQGGKRSAGQLTLPRAGCVVSLRSQSLAFASSTSIVRSTVRSGGLVALLVLLLILLLILLLGLLLLALLVLLLGLLLIVLLGLLLLALLILLLLLLGLFR